jgi:hypothetical protein
MIFLDAGNRGKTLDAARDLSLYLILWVVVAAVVVAAHWRRQLHGVGLVLGYVIGLTLIHFTGAIVYLADIQHLHDPDEVAIGFREATLGLIAFAVGSLVIGPSLLATRRHPLDQEQRYEMDSRLPKAYLLIGTISYVALATFLGDIPTLSALVAAGQQVFIVGLCLLCWKAWKEKRRYAFARLLLVALMFPFITMAVQGFIGFGAASMAVVLLFAASFVRPRWKLLVVALIGIYVGLSVFVTYSQDRAEIREVVWGGRPMPERFERVYLSTIQTEWFDPGNEVHLSQIDNRLNQNHLVGAAVQHLDASQRYGHGETIVQSFLALVPRFLWPEKDIEAGSGDLVSQYTGLEFGEATSVGIGHVLEFYVNFGSVGLLVGMLMMGTIVTVLDVLAGRRLAVNDWRAFAPLFLVGVSFLHVGGSFVELSASAAASLLLVLFTNGILYRFQRGTEKHSFPSDPAVSPESSLR